MVRQRYFVSVGTQEIVPEGEAVNHEFEIEATEEEVHRLQQLFDRSQDKETDLIGRAKTPYESFPEPDQDMKNEPYDERLREVYRFIHRLGMPKTRNHIERMNIL